MRFLCLTCALMLCLVGPPPCRAADKPAPVPSDDQQYANLAEARNKAELALRRNRLAFETGQAQWVSASTALDQTKLKIGAVLDKALLLEMRKDESDRNLNFMDEVRDRRGQLDDDALRFAANERARMDREFHRAIDMTTALTTALLNFIALERTYKDLGMDLNTISSGYDGIAAKAEEAHDMGQKALEDLIAARHAWNETLMATQRWVKERPAVKAAP